MDCYPELFSQVDEQDLLRALLRDAAVIPFLDGFDEVARDRRVLLLQALQREMGAELPVAPASRTEQFREAAAAAGRVPR